MKRPSKYTPKDAPRIIDFKRDLSEPHLASLGALTLAFNDAQAALDRLFYVASEIPEDLWLEISTRIGGIDGILAIAKNGAARFLSEKDLRQLQDLLGDGWFKKLKDYRDGVIHARHINPSTGISVEIDRQASVNDFLIRKDALDAAYDLLIAIRKEIDEAAKLIALLKGFKAAADDDPNKALLEAKIADSRAQFQQHQIERLALPPIPGFPSESELRAADFLVQRAQTAILLGHFQEWPLQFQPVMHPGLYGDFSNYPSAPPQPAPKKEDEGKK